MKRIAVRNYYYLIIHPRRTIHLYHVYNIHTIDKSIIGRLPYTSDIAPINGDAKNCRNENRDPMKPAIDMGSFQIAMFTFNQCWCACDDQ